MILKKKGQAAMEFLMTYGWAILVVLVVIGALAYFGVLNPSNLLPEKCTFPLQLSCRDQKIGTANIKFVLQNGAGKDMKITNVTVKSEAISNAGKTAAQGTARDTCQAVGTPVIAAAAGNDIVGGSLAGSANPTVVASITVPNGGSQEFTIGATGAVNSCDFKDTGRDKNRYMVFVTYQWLDSTYLHTIEGELFAAKP